MISIPKGQFELASRMARDRADSVLIGYARARFPALYEGAPEVELRRLVEGVRATAASYRVEREDDVATFLDLTVMYGDDFHRARWAMGALEHPTMHGPDKMALLRHQVRLSGVEI